MKYFRHPPLAFWSVIVALLVAVSAFALISGQDPQPIAREQTRGQKSEDVLSTRMRISDLTRVALPPASELSEWSEETAKIADRLADKRRAAGGKEDDLGQIYQALADDSRRLAAVDPADTSAVKSGVLLVQADGDALTAVLYGADAKDVRPIVTSDIKFGGEVPLTDPLPDTEDPTEKPLDPGTGDVPVIPVNPALPNNPVLPANPS